MPTPLAPWVPRRFVVVVIALSVCLSASYLPLEHRNARGDVLGERVATRLAGTLAHACARGAPRAIALVHGAPSSIAPGARELESPYAVARARRPASRGHGELTLVPAPTRRSRAVEPAPQGSRVSRAATPRAPPGV